MSLGFNEIQNACIPIRGREAYRHGNLRGHGRGDVGLLAGRGAGADAVVLFQDGLLGRDDSAGCHDDGACMMG